MEMVDANALAEIIPPTKFATWDLNSNGFWSRSALNEDRPIILAERLARAARLDDRLFVELPGTYGWNDEAVDTGYYNEENDEWQEWDGYEPWEPTDYFPGRYNEWQKWTSKAETGSPRGGEEALVVEAGTQIPQALVDEVRAFIQART